MYTEDILRSSQAYGVLVRCGMFAHGLRGNYHRKGDGWEICFTVFSDIGKERAKEYAKGYLTDAYGATGIYLFQKASDKDNQFRASFHRGDL